MSSMPKPERIRISKSRGVLIEWSDGHQSRFDPAYLRDNCPCATCRSATDVASSVLPLYKPKPEVLAADPVGTYAINFRFSDGHSTGIYTYEYLRSLCRCEDCQPRLAQER